MEDTAADMGEVMEATVEGMGVMVEDMEATADMVEDMVGAMEATVVTDEVTEDNKTFRKLR